MKQANVRVIPRLDNDEKCQSPFGDRRPGRRDVHRAKRGCAGDGEGRNPDGRSSGDNSIINTRASVDHGGCVGSHVHIAPGAILSGEVILGDGCHVGTGTLIRNGIRIGSGVMIPMGSIVTKDQGNQEIIRKPSDGPGKRAES